MSAHHRGRSLAESTENMVNNVVLTSSAEMPCCFQSIKGNTLISYNVNIIYNSFLNSDIMFDLTLLSKPIE